MASTTKRGSGRDEQPSGSPRAGRRWFERALPALALMAALALAGQAAGAAAPLRVMMVMDDSSSMRANDPQGLVKDATRDFVSGLSDADSAGLVIFSGEARLVAPLARLSSPGARAALLSAIDGQTFGGARTDIAAGVERALYELRSGAPAAGDARDAMVVVTDGLMDVGSPSRDAERLRWLREDLVADAASRGVRIVGIAFTEKADWALLQQLAHGTKGAYFRALAREDLSPLFARAREALVAEAAAPASPSPSATPSASAAPTAAAPPAEPRIVMVPTEPKQQTGLIAMLVAAIVLGLSVILALVLRRPQRGEASPTMPLRVLGSESGAGSDEAVHGILQDVATGERHRLTKAVTTLGRREDCDIALDDKTVSGQHARIARRGGLFYVSDLRSTNGTYLNDARVEGERLLRAGDLLRLDTHQFRYEGELPEGQARWPESEGTVLRLASDGK